MSLFITDGVRGVLRFGPCLRFVLPLGLRRRVEGVRLRLLAEGRLARDGGRRLRLRPPPVIVLGKF